MRGDRYGWVVGTDNRHLNDIGRRNNRRSRESYRAVRVRDCRARLCIAPGNSVDEEIHRRIVGAHNVQSDIERVADPDVGSVIRLQREHHLPRSDFH